MKRFIDLRQHKEEGDIGYRFAWFDTITDTFETYQSTQVWDTWSDFCSLYDGDEIHRYRNLTPSWAFEEENER